MPFSIKVNLGSGCPVLFEGWLDDSFDKYVLKGTAFAKASDKTGPGFIVTNGPMVLSSKAPLAIGSKIDPGGIIATGAADGEDIPYGKPFCIFVLAGALQAGLRRVRAYYRHERSGSR
jgi:hypothetical protein